MIVRYDSFRKYLCEILTEVHSYYQSKNCKFLEQCVEVNVSKIVVQILQGSVVTQTVLGGLTL